MLAWFARIGRNSEEFDRVRLRHSQHSPRKSTAQQYVLGIVLLPADLRIVWEPVYRVLYRVPVKSSVNGQCALCKERAVCILSTVTEYRYHFEFCSAYFIRITDTRHGPAPRAMALAMAPARAGSVTDGA